jgi:PilZ domain
LSLAVNPVAKDPQECRTAAEMPVRVWGITSAGELFLQSAQVVRAGAYRATLGGMEHEVAPGDTLGVECQGRRGRFCVVRAGQAGTSEAGQVEIRPLDNLQNFWGTDLQAFNEQQAFIERRAQPRYACRGSIRISQPDVAGSISAAVTDISLGGCYVELMETYAMGTRLSALLNAESISIRFTAEVRTSHPGMGMGMKFEEISESDRAALERLIAKLAGRE